MEAVARQAGTTDSSDRRKILDLIYHRNDTTEFFADLRGDPNSLGGHAEEHYERIRENEKIILEDEVGEEVVPRMNWRTIPFHQASAQEGVSRAGKRLARRAAYVYDMELTKVLGMGACGAVALFTVTDLEGKQVQIVGKIYPDDGEAWKSQEVGFLQV
jgi:hypothetical protein